MLNNCVYGTYRAPATIPSITYSHRIPFATWARELAAGQPLARTLHVFWRMR